MLLFGSGTQGDQTAATELLANMKFPPQDCLESRGIGVKITVKARA